MVHKPMVIRTWKNICNVLDCGHRRTAKRKLVHYEKKYSIKLLHYDGDRIPFMIISQLEKVFIAEMKE